MDYSIFLAKLFGLYLIITGLAYALRQDFLRAVVNDFYDSPALIVIASVINLILGLILVLTHSVWGYNYKVVITLFGYLILFKGIINLFAPTVTSKWSERLLSGNGYTYISLVTILIGLYLSYIGFVA